MDPLGIALLAEDASGRELEHLTEQRASLRVLADAFDNPKAVPLIRVLGSASELLDGLVDSRALCEARLARARRIVPATTFDRPPAVVPVVRQR